jgi:hypothetical protein
MSIKQRLEDAIALWKIDRQEGAWVQVLISAAATSRIRFRKKKDGKAFEEFIKEVSPTILDHNAPAVPGGITINLAVGATHQTSLQSLLYKSFRCCLVHEGKIDENVGYSKFQVKEGYIESTISVAQPMQIPIIWALTLAKAVAEAPENREECREVHSEIVSVIENLK